MTQILLKIMRILSCTLLLVFLGETNRGERNSITIDSFIHRGIRATILQDYSTAMATFDSLKRLTEQDPRPYFYQAGALQARMMDFEDYSEVKQFHELLNRCIKYAEKWIAIDSLRAMGYFYKGASYSYRGFFYAQRKQYFQGIRDAMIGIKYLERGIQIDSTFYDAYLGIGTYKYWRSRLTRVLNWLPFFPDRREEGLKMIEQAVQKGRYGRDVALNGLIWIEIDRHHFARAARLSLEMLRKYPESRFFLWPLAASYFRAGYFVKAIEIYNRLLASFHQEKENNHYNEMICGLKIAESYFRLKNYVRARETAARALELPLPPELHNQARNKIVRLQQIVKWSHERMKSKENQKKNRF